MLTSTCFCGQELTGADRDAQVEMAVAHFDADHAHMGLTSVNMRNYLEREGALTGPKERLDSIGAIRVADLGPEHVDDVLRFFDHNAFADNPAWASCYCMAHHVTESEWNERTWQRNRDDLAARINAGTTTGTLAYVDDNLAGWCNASVRSELPDYANGEADDAVGVVGCFVIAPPYRRHSLARELLDAALDQFRRRGIRVAEGYPATEVTTSAVAYRGTIPLYESAGFELVKRGPRTSVLRREL